MGMFAGITVVLLLLFLCLIIVIVKRHQRDKKPGTPPDIITNSTSLSTMSPAYVNEGVHVENVHYAVPDRSRNGGSSSYSTNPLFIPQGEDRTYDISQHFKRAGEVGDDSLDDYTTPASVTVSQEAYEAFQPPWEMPAGASASPTTYVVPTDVKGGKKGGAASASSGDPRYQNVLLPEDYGTSGPPDKPSDGIYDSAVTIGQAMKKSTPAPKEAPGDLYSVPSKKGKGKGKKREKKQKVTTQPPMATRVSAAPTNSPEYASLQGVRQSATSTDYSTLSAVRGYTEPSSLGKGEESAM